MYDEPTVALALEQADQAARLMGAATVAREIGVVESVFSRWRTGQSVPTGQNRAKLIRWAKLEAPPAQEDLAAAHRRGALEALAAVQATVGQMMLKWRDGATPVPAEVTAKAAKPPAKKGRRRGG